MNCQKTRSLQTNESFATRQPNFLVPFKPVHLPPQQSPWGARFLVSFDRIERSIHWLRGAVMYNLLAMIFLFIYVFDIFSIHRSWFWWAVESLAVDSCELWDGVVCSQAWFSELLGFFRQFDDRIKNCWRLHWGTAQCLIPFFLDRLFGCWEK